MRKREVQLKLLKSNKEKKRKIRELTAGTMKDEELKGKTEGRS